MLSRASYALKIRELGFCPFSVRLSNFEVILLERMTASSLELMINKEKKPLARGSRWHRDCTLVTGYPHYIVVPVGAEAKSG
jgi:hypothetical protein